MYFGDFRFLLFPFHQQNLKGKILVKMKTTLYHLKWTSDFFKKEN